jgi:hypothetical protein
MFVLKIVPLFGFMYCLLRGPACELGVAAPGLRGAPGRPGCGRDTIINITMLHVGCCAHMVGMGIAVYRGLVSLWSAWRWSWSVPYRVQIYVRAKLSLVFRAQNSSQRVRGTAILVTYGKLRSHTTRDKHMHVDAAQQRPQRSCTGAHARPRSSRSI